MKKIIRKIGVALIGIITVFKGMFVKIVNASQVAILPKDLQLDYGVPTPIETPFPRILTIVSVPLVFLIGCMIFCIKSKKSKLVKGIVCGVLIAISLIWGIVIYNI